MPGQYIPMGHCSASVCEGQKYPEGQGPVPSGVTDPRGQKKPSKQRCGVLKFLGIATFVDAPERQ
jgi:hypothetical protein